MNTDKFTVEMIVNNHFGVLNRVTALFSKRGYNINSIVANETNDPKFSKMAISCFGDEYMQRQIVCQLEKLHDVISVTLLDKNSL